MVFIDRFAATLTLSLCLFALPNCTTAPKDTAFQTSTIDALIAGVYDGNMTCRELMKHGNFGIGTFDTLDGEMVLLDGKMYQVKSDGKVYEPNHSLRTPFATVTRFTPEKRFTLPAGTDFTDLEKIVDQQAPNKNLFLAIKITGKFKLMHTRSVPSQKKPYPALNIVTKSQPEFHLTEVSGTIVGFRCPPYVKGVNVPGYHLHFIDDARTVGGHILGFELTEGQCEVDTLNQYRLSLPADEAAFAATDLSKDRSQELHAVEKGNN